MGSITTIGLENLIDDLSSLAQIPDTVIDDILTAQADVIEPEQRKMAKSMGVYRTGVTKGSIKRTKIKIGKDGKYLDIYPQGKNTAGNTNAEVAFVNEFGKKNQPARPFIRTANENKTDQAVEQARKVLDTFISSKNL